MQKGISQLITAILLIGITVMVAGVMANWLFKLSAGQAGIIEAKGGEIRCHFAGLAVSNVSYNCDTGKLSLNAENTGDKTLTDFKFMIILENASVVTSQVEGILNPQNDSEFSIQAPNALNYTKLFFLSQTCPTIARVDISPDRIVFIEPGLCGVPAVVYFLNVSAEPETIKFSEGVCKSNITAHLTDSAGNPFADETIEFKITPKLVGDISPSYVNTNGSGIAKTNLTIFAPETVNVTASATIDGVTTNGSVDVLCTSDNTPPTSVTNLHWTGNVTPTLTNSTTIILNWTAATDESGIKQYKIYIWENQNASGYVLWGTNTSATGYSFTGADGKNYSANVTAVDNVNNENTTGTVTDTVLTVELPDLVLYLKFDESEGTLAKDSSGYGNDGTLYNGSAICSGGDCPTWKSGADCKSGSCLEFDGDNDFVDCGSSSSLNIGNKFTIESWMNTTFSFPELLPIASKYSELGWELSIQNGNMVLYIESGAIWKSVQTTGSFNNGNWHNVVGVRNESDLKIYVDGIEVDATSGGTDFVTSTDDITALLLIGAGYSPTPEYFFNGTIDEVKIYNRALSPEEIMAHYESLK